MKSNSHISVNVMMSKDPNNISLVIDFISRMVDKHGVKNKKIHEIKTKFGEKRMFYLVKCEVFDDLSLLEYVDTQNIRLSRQREELIDLSVKIANKNNNNGRDSQEEVINHFKSGLPSGVGLRDMINQIKERYPWSTSKKTLKIFLSLVTCLLGVGLYVMDLATDVKFSMHMLNGPKYSNESQNFDFENYWTEKGFNFSSLRSFNSECYEHIKNVSRPKEIKRRDFLPDKDYKTTGWIALYHCIQPFLVTLVVFLSINCKKWQIRTPNILLAIGRIVPNPAFTYIFSFYLTVKKYNARSHPDFRSKIASTEDEIRKHESLGKF